MKQFVLFLLLCGHLCAHAQPTKGDVLFSGNASYYSEKVSWDPDNSFKYRYFQVSPKLGYFFGQHVAGGLSLIFNFSKSETASGPEVQPSNARTLDLGPFVRYYIPLSEKVFGITEVSYGWGWIWEKTITFDPLSGELVTVESEKNYQVAVAGAGISYFLRPGVALDLVGQYYAATRNKGTDKSGFQATLGFQVYLKRAK